MDFVLCGTFNVNGNWCPVYMVHDMGELICEVKDVGRRYLSNLYVIDRELADDNADMSLEDYISMAEGYNAEGYISTFRNTIILNNSQATVYPNTDEDTEVTFEFDYYVEFDESNY